MSESKTDIPITKRSEADNAWLGLGNVNKLKFDNPYENYDKERPGIDAMRLFRNPDYLSYAADVLLDIQNLPEQSVVLEELWKRPAPMYIASRGFGKSYLLAEYAMLKCILIPGTKVVIVGAAFRQSKVIFEYMVNIWQNAPILRSLCDGDSGPRSSPDRCLMRINDSWAMAVPLGDGSKIRGLRAHIIMADEFASIPPDIFETVVRGFTAVSAKPVENVQAAAKRKYMQEAGEWMEENEDLYSSRRRNQVIISGTADYDFKHYADYWKRYCQIIRSQGDENKLKAIFDDNEIPEHFDWEDFSVLRIPYELIPEGFMDDKQVAQAKATVHSGVYQMEYGACFTSDSDGFFKRSLIETCVTNQPITHPSGDVSFDAMVHGNNFYKYVYGVDPASEQDNFSIVIIEMREDHNRIVHTWTTNRKDFQKRRKAGLVEEGDFYGFCARKIRDLTKVFPTENIAIDAQGGGIAVMEALHDPAKLHAGERLLWPIVDPDKEQLYDGESGEHILHMCQFADYKWTAEANHGLRKDFEDKFLLFPRFDGFALTLATEYDSRMAKETSMYDSLEDAVMEIEELKNELCTITVTVTGTGVSARDRWDTPEIVQANGRKGRIRKDRYSSLVMANMIARQIHRVAGPVKFGRMIGGFSKDIVQNGGAANQQLYSGPAWYTEGIGDGSWMKGVKRG
tara:strand:- start:1787 stop:3832 length:2046 start_codon:yes stop_codon:yes gene_type:complete